MILSDARPGKKTCHTIVQDYSTLIVTAHDFPCFGPEPFELQGPATPGVPPPPPPPLQGRERDTRDARDLRQDLRQDPRQGGNQQLWPKGSA